MRFNTGKIQWGLVDWDCFEDMVRVLEFGAQKYDAWNWKKGLTTVSICESMQRHINAYLRGEDADPESGISHIGHIQCNSMFLAYMQRYMADGFDNRYIDPNKQRRCEGDIVKFYELPFTSNPHQTVPMKNKNEALSDDISTETK